MFVANYTLLLVTTGLSLNVSFVHIYIDFKVVQFVLKLGAYNDNKIERKR